VIVYELTGSVSSGLTREQKSLSIRSLQFFLSPILKSNSSNTMTKCFYCQTDFPLLPSPEGKEVNVKCGKCLIRKPGQSAPEIAVINVLFYVMIQCSTTLLIYLQAKPQCAGCGITTNSLQRALCNGCISVYRVSWFIFVQKKLHLIRT